MTDKKDNSKFTPKTAWKKGQTGNPGGRSPKIGPNGETATQLAREHTKAAIDCLVDICKDTEADSNHRVAAANGLLDRGWGKPSQAMELTGAGGGPILSASAPEDLTDAQLVALIAGSNAGATEPPESTH